MTPTDARLPVPVDPDRLPEWEEGRRRRRMLEGSWRQDLEAYMSTVLNTTRLDNLGRLDTSINLWRSTVSQLATIYDREPTVQWSGDADEGADAPADVMADLLSDAAWWQMAPRHAQYVVGLRESLVRIDVAEGDDLDPARIRLRLVPADTVEVRTHPDDPFRLLEVREYRLRRREGEWDYYADVYQLDAAGGPSFRIEDSKQNDVTSTFVEVAPENPWPWRDPGENGQPWMPWVLYHAEPTGKTWDPWTLSELVDGAFFTALSWNHWHHVMRDASWAQRILIDGDVRGAEVHQAGAATAGVITTSPTSVLLVRSDPDRSASTATYAPASDPTDYATAILSYQSTMVGSLGIHASDLERSSGTAQSGYAIQLRRSAQRRVARSMEPQFRRGDLRLLSLIARTATAWQIATLPAEGWSITYQYLEDPVEDRMAEHEYRRALAADGLLSRSEWYRLTHPGTDREQAVAAILDAALEAKAIDAASDAMVIDAETASALTMAQEQAAAMLAERGDELPPEARAVFEALARTAAGARPMMDEDDTPDSEDPDGA